MMDRETPPRPERPSPLSDTTRWGFIGDFNAAVHGQDRVILEAAGYEVVLSKVDRDCVVITDTHSRSERQLRFQFVGAGSEAEIVVWIGRPGEEPEAYRHASEELASWTRNLLAEGIR